MAYAYHVYLVDPSLPYAPLRHTFYGETKEQCLERFEAHQSVCESFGPAVAEDRISDAWEEIPEGQLPWVE